MTTESPTPHTRRRYVLAALLLIAAVGLRVALTPWLGASILYFTVTAAVVVSAWYLGPGPSLLVLVGGIVGVVGFVLAARGTTLIRDFSVGMGAVLTLGLGLAIIRLFHALRTARERADVAADAARAEVERRRRVEADLARERELLHVTLLSVADAVIATDAGGCVTFMNPIAEQLTGWSAGEAAGNPLPEVFRVVDEIARVEVENPVLHALRDGRIVGLANHSVLLSRSGAETAIDDSAAPIRDPTGGIAGAVLIFRDITARRQQERRAQEQMQKLEEQGRLLALAPVLVRDLSSRIVMWNLGTTEMYGYQAEEAIGQVSHELLRTRFPGAVEDLQAALLRDGSWQGELVHTRKDGSEVTVLSRWVLHRDESGSPARILEVNHDITDRRRLEQELRRAADELADANQRKDQLLEALRDADHRKDVFLATLAHELRNPLAPIRNAVDILRDAQAVAATRDSARDMISRQMTIMVRLLDDLLDVSRISRGRMLLRRERVDLATVVRSAIEQARPLIDSHRHQLAVSLPGAPVPLDADPTRLAQVFANLLNNAAKYTNPGGHIALTVSRADGRAVVSVLDSGIGILPQNMPGLFDMFSQAAPALERSYDGLGVGLSLARGLAELHGGTIEARSDGEGRGSEFVVSLPVVDGAPLPAPQPAPPHAENGNGSPRRVLVVDDNHDSADSMAMMLELMGHQVRAAYDGEEAIDTAAEFRPELVLLDIGLPKLNGYDAARRIRREPWGKALLLVAVTGWGQDEDKRRAAEAGFDRHLTKPVDPATVVKLLDEMSD